MDEIQFDQSSVLLSVSVLESRSLISAPRYVSCPEKSGENLKEVLVVSM